MTWHDKRLPSFSFWQIITCHDGKPFDLPWVWRIFHDVSRMLHPDSPHLTMISTFFSVWQMKQKALLIPSHYLQDSNFLTFFLTQSTRFIKASMVEITLPSSKLRSCAEAGRSIAEETSTKERHCLRAAEGGWKPPTKMGLLEISKDSHQRKSILSYCTWNWWLFLFIQKSGMERSELLR